MNISWDHSSQWDNWTQPNTFLALGMNHWWIGGWHSPSGKRLHNYGKITTLIGKSTTNAPIAMSNYQRVVDVPNRFQPTRPVPTGRNQWPRPTWGGLHQEKFTAQAQKTETPARSSWKRMPFLRESRNKRRGNIDIMGKHGKIRENHGVFTNFKMYQEDSNIFKDQNKWQNPNRGFCSPFRPWKVRALITCNYPMERKLVASFGDSM